MTDVECICPTPDERVEGCEAHAPARYAALCPVCDDRMSEHEEGCCLTCEDWGGPCA